MLSTGHSAQSRAFPLNKAPQSSPGNPKRLVYIAGSGLHHRGPCKCACRGWPAQYTIGSFLEAWAAGPPAVPHHRLPTQGIQDGGCHSHSAGTGNQAHPSF